MSEKKQVPLRISKELYDALSRWADDEFRSLNGQIEYLLTQSVKERNKGKITPGEESSPELHP